MDKMNMDSAITCVDFYDARIELDDMMSAIGGILGVMETAMTLSDKYRDPARAAAYVNALRCEVLRATNKLSEIVKMCDKLTGGEETNE